MQALPLSRKRTSLRNDLASVSETRERVRLLRVPYSRCHVCRARVAGMTDTAGASRLLSPVRVRLVAVDVDGTLLTSTHQVTPGTVEAVREARARGLEVVLTTSRPPIALRPVLDRLGLTEPAEFIGSQGAMTGAYTADGHLREIARRPMPLDLAHAAVRAARSEGLAVSWFTGERWLVTHVDAQVRREAWVVGCEPVVADLDGEREGPEKLLVIAPDGAAEVLTRLAAALPAGLHAQTSNPTYLEITRADVDKASALQALCARRGVDRAAVAAIGDGMNDLPMLAFAAVAVAPANARPAVLAQVDLVVPSNDEDGVAHALRRLAAG